VLYLYNILYLCGCVCVRRRAYGTTGTVNSGWRTGVTNDSTRCSAGRGISIISNERNHRTMRVAAAARETRKEVKVGFVARLDVISTIYRSYPINRTPLPTYLPTYYRLISFEVFALKKDPKKLRDKRFYWPARTPTTDIRYIANGVAYTLTPVKTTTAYYYYYYYYYNHNHNRTHVFGA